MKILVIILLTLFSFGFLEKSGFFLAILVGTLFLALIPMAVFCIFSVMTNRLTHAKNILLGSSVIMLVYCLSNIFKFNVRGNEALIYLAAVYYFGLSIWIFKNSNLKKVLIYSQFLMTFGIAVVLWAYLIK